MIFQNFKITGQHIERVEWQDFVADSRNLISFRFAFDTAWDGVNKTAAITTGGVTYNSLIGADGTASSMPVLSAGACTVSVFGGDLYTADEVRLQIGPSGLKNGATPVAPPVDIYNQILTKASNAETHATAAENLANDTQNKAATEARKAGDSAVSAGAAADAAGRFMTDAAGSAQRAKDTAAAFDTHAAAKTTAFDSNAAAKTKLVTDEGTRQVGLVSAEGAAQTAAAKLEADRAAAAAAKTAADRLVVESAAAAESGRVTEETKRVSNETSRKNSESVRIETENARVSAETARAAEEKTRAQSEAARGVAEGTRCAKEDERLTAEQARITEESSRKTAEVARVAAEDSRFTKETARETAEQTRGTAEGTRKTAEQTRETSESARKTAEGNRATAETGRNDAEKLRESTTAGIVKQATEQATLAAADATAAGTSATEAAASAKRADDIVKSITLNKYSVRFTGAAPAGVREDSAVGMVANVAVGGATVKNDFDRVSFFDRPICCCTRSLTAKSGWIVNAYRGEPGFAADGTNGEVLYECKPFFYKASTDLTYVSVAATPMEGYQLAPMFKDGDTRVYCPSYWMGSVGGKATSRSGDIPSTGGPNSLTTLARTFDAGAFLEPMTVRFSDYLLQLVEFANRNLKAIMAGAQIMRYNGEFDKIVSVVSPAIFTTTAAVGGYFVDGQSISIGSTRNGSNRVYNVKINTIVTAGDVSTFTLNVPVPTMAVGDFISTRCWQNGATDVVVASSGSPVSNSDGKHPCIWRGKVDPWAHCFTTLADVLVKREGLGTAESPYSYIPYFLPDPKKYANGAITADYVRCNTVLPPTSGYVKALGQDSRYPAAFGPSELGAASNTYASAYFYNYGYEVAGLLAGGYWSGGGGCSPVYFYCAPPSGSALSILGRLFVLSE